MVTSVTWRLPLRTRSLGNCTRQPGLLPGPVPIDLDAERYAEKRPDEDETRQNQQVLQGRVQALLEDLVHEGKSCNIYLHNYATLTLNHWSPDTSV